VATGDRVVAEIGPQKITASDLDRQIERQIDRQLSQLSSYLPEEARNRQKENLLKQLTTASQRRGLLNQLILEEILYRRALESKMTDDPHVRDLLGSQERSLLARMVIEKEFAEKIKITPVDLHTYYEAHKKEFVTPERIKIAHILLPNETDANNALNTMKTADDFEDLAKNISMDEATRDNGGRIPGWIEKDDEIIPGIGKSADAQRIIFATDTGRVASEPVITDKGAHVIKVLEHEKERQKGFDEVKNDVFRSLRSQKERDVQQRLLHELEKQYDVVIHQTAFLDDEKGN
jgi:parvulin-like peptidyl-prolyl isomerase